MTLTNVIGATVADSLGQGTIVNDDLAYLLNVDAAPPIVSGAPPAGEAAPSVPVGTGGRSLVPVLAAATLVITVAVGLRIRRRRAVG